MYGRIYHFANRDIYLAYQKLEHIARYGEKCSSDAIRKEMAAWSIDEETLTEVRLKGIEWVGIEVKNNGDRYITRLSNFMDREKLLSPPTHIRSSVQRRYLPMKFFHHIPAPMKVPRR